MDSADEPAFESDGLQESWAKSAHRAIIQHHRERYRRQSFRRLYPFLRCAHMDMEARARLTDEI